MSQGFKGIFERPSKHGESGEPAILSLKNQPVRLFIDLPKPEEEHWASRPIRLRGWTFSTAGKVEKVEAFLGEDLLGALFCKRERPDVVSHHPEEAPLDCGFDQFVPLNNPDPGLHDLTVKVTDSAGNVASKSLSITIIAPPERQFLPPGTSFLDRLKRSLASALQPIQKSSNQQRTPRVEIRIPISANEMFMRMLRYFLESLQVFGGPLGRSAHCVVSVSRDEPYRDLLAEYQWVRDYSVEFQWLDQDYFDRLEYDGTGAHRFDIPSEADVVLLLDADLLIAGDFDPIIRDAQTSQRVLGFLAHGSPFWRPIYQEIPAEQWWQWIFENAELPCPELNGVPSAWGLLSEGESTRWCPESYFNYGVIVGPRKLIESLGDTFESELESIDRIIDTPLRSQMANVLVFARHGIETGLLPLNYNFTMNLPGEKLRELNPDPRDENSPGDVKIFHYLARGEVNKWDFATEESFEELLNQTELSAYGMEFVRKLRIVHESIVSRR